jgi:hypothetical protein
MKSGSIQLLRILARPTLLCRNKPRPYPYTAGTEHERSRKTATIIHAAGCDELHGLAGKWGFVAFAGVGAGGDEDTLGPVRNGCYEWG